MANGHDQKAPPQGRHMELFQQRARMLQEPPLGEDVRILKKSYFVERLFHL